MGDGIFDGFFGGVGEVLADAGGFVRDILVAKEDTRQAAITQQTTADTLLAGKAISVEQVRVIALAILGVVALVLLTRKRRA